MAEGTNLGNAYIQIIPSAKGISGSISKALNGEAESAGTSAGNILSGSFKAAAKTITAVTGAAAAAVGKLAQSAVSSYANYEQLVGGVETLFGLGGESMSEYADRMGQTVEEIKNEWVEATAGERIVLNNADKAYKTAGLSANEYMETVTSFAASLTQSLGGDTKAAARMADVAITDMADNANKMGSSMESIQNAYQGFSKQNYTMLDNLKLGYGGTASEMYRLLEDAAALNDEFADTAKFSIDSSGHLEAGYADIVEAIHIVQENMGLTGTTAKEAATTIEGTAKSTKAAWENVVTAIARGEDLDYAFDGLTEAIFGESEGEGLLNQIIPRIQTTLEGTGTFISTAAPMITEKLPELITAVVPSLLSSAQTMVEALGEGLLTSIPILMPTITQLIIDLANMLISALPQIVQVGAEVMLSIVDGISQALPELIPKIVEVIIKIAQSLIDNLPMIIETGVNLINGLIDGLVNAIPILVEALPQIIQSLVDAVIESLPLIIDGAIQLINGIVGALPEIINALVNALPEIINSVVDALITAIPLLIQGLIQLINGIVAALPEILTALIEALPTIITAVIDGLVALMPAIIEGAIQLVMGIVAALPEIIVALVEAMPQLVMALISGITYAIPALWNMLTGVVTSLFEKLGELGSNLLTWASEAFTNLINTITEFLSALPEKMAYYAGYAIGSFIAFFRDLPENLAEIWETIKTKVAEFGENFKTKATEIGTNFFNSLVDGIKNLPTKIATLATDLVDEVKKLPDKFLEIGTNIVEGLWNGISGAWEWLKEKVSNLASNLLQGAKDALGIASPSKAFRDQVGKWIPAGIAVGITGNMSSLNKAMTDMSDEMLNSSLNEIPGMSFGRYSYNSGMMATSGGYNQTVNIYSPRELTPSEVARQTKNATRNMVLALRGV